MPNDYGYFGKGSTGYAHYQQTFNRCFGSGSGGGGHRPPRTAAHQETTTTIITMVAAVIMAVVLPQSELPL